MEHVAALYIDPRGPYPKLLGPEWCWDEARDARTYAGPWPVVAHPPCGPWSSFAHMSAGDPMLALRAVDQVRSHGGVLEHPAGSRLFATSGKLLPRPGELPDEHGGFTVEVDQLHWGHVAHKRTWLYCVGVDTSAIGRSPEPERKPTHRVARDRRMSDPARGLLERSAEQRRRTPVAFAEWLIALARTVESS